MSGVSRTYLFGYPLRILIDAEGTELDITEHLTVERAKVTLDTGAVAAQVDEHLRSRPPRRPALSRPLKWTIEVDDLNRGG